jgi:hypothetical protein
MVSSYSTDIMGSSTEFSRAQESGWQKVQNEFGSLPFNCADLDKQIKRISEKLLSERKKDPLPSVEQKAYMDALELKKSAWEGMWATNGCRDIIENIRLQSMAVVETSSAIKQEESVLDKGKKDQSLYIGLGGVVLLIGLYIVLK